MVNSIDYDLEALRKNVERCDDNIRTFEDAIAAEEANKSNLRRMIRALERDQTNDSKN